jgi:hypothetical protein
MKWLMMLAMMVSTSAFSDTIDYELAFSKLKGAYSQCQTNIDNRDIKIAALEQQLKNVQSYQTALDGIVLDLKVSSKNAQLLISKQEKIIALSQEIENNYQKNTQLCQQSMDDLIAKVKELNALYNQAFKECLKPWYYRWETWLAFATGLAIGIPL